MILKRIFAKQPDPARILYEAIVAAARQPKFYLDHAVADTIDGRFDMIALHMFLVLERMRGQGGTSENVRQQLTDHFFLDMDRSLREMGVGDLSVGKKVRKMAEVFYGRVAAYDTAGREGPEALVNALARNVYADATSPHAEGLAEWVKSARDSLADQSPDRIVQGEVRFP